MSLDISRDITISYDYYDGVTPRYSSALSRDAVVAAAQRRHERMRADLDYLDGWLRAMDTGNLIQERK